MPAKGNQYATIQIDLKEWVREYLSSNNLKQTDLAKMLNVNRSRVHEMLNGNLNTMMYLEIVVDKIYKGDFLVMAKYAQTTEGLDMLKHLNATRKMNPLQKEIANSAMSKIYEVVLRDLTFEDKDKLIELINNFKKK